MNVDTRCMLCVAELSSMTWPSPRNPLMETIPSLTEICLIVGDCIHSTHSLGLFFCPLVCEHTKKLFISRKEATANSIYQLYLLPNASASTLLSENSYSHFVCTYVHMRLCAFIQDKPPNRHPVIEQRAL